MAPKVFKTKEEVLASKRQSVIKTQNARNKRRKQADVVANNPVQFT